MKIAFCLFRYFPFGGLQRDFLRIALACQQRGHAIHVYTMAWEGAIPPDFQLHLIHVTALTNHGRAKQFIQCLDKLLQQADYDIRVGFNRMPGLNIYYAADSCYAALLQDRSWFYRLLPRQRTYLALEQALFASTATTHVFALTPAQQQQFASYYQMPAARMHLLPPGIELQRMQNYSMQQRAALRQRNNILPHQKIMLMVGSNFKGKGVDRALYACAALPAHLRDHTRLWVIGRGKAKPMHALAKHLKIAKQVTFLGPQEELAAYYAMADLLVHPAYQEAAGMVLLEAICSGLPVLVTANSGYAYHVERAQAGCLIAQPFKQETMNQQLLAMLTTTTWQTWRENALRYAAHTQLGSLATAAAEMIEQIATASLISAKES